MDYTALKTFLASEPRLARWLETLDADIARGLDSKRHGDLPAWLDALAAMPQVAPQSITLDTEVSISGAPTQAEYAQMHRQLEALIPWRKGPYTLHGIHLDTEWRSDWKWQRIREHIAPLKHRQVLDVGCGNGYHGWRMLGDGAARVIGIDPSPRFVVQFQMIKRLAGSDYPIDVLPLGIEQLPANLQSFDTTFSMGVFYHRRSPMDHLRELKATLRPGGQLVLETLIINGKEGEVLVPPGRYAMMNNVWFLPSAATLISWMQKCGLKNPRVVDTSLTTTDEQRATHWMRFHSLENFLDPKDPSRTIEGHPAPRRAVFLAEV